MINYGSGNSTKINNDWILDISNNNWGGVDILHKYQSDFGGLFCKDHLRFILESMDKIERERGSRERNPREKEREIQERGERLLSLASFPFFLLLSSSFFLLWQNKGGKWMPWS